jgi:hypothetical protein
MYPSSLGVRRLQRIDNRSKRVEFSGVEVVQHEASSRSIDPPKRLVQSRRRIALLGKLRGASVSTILSQRVRRENAAALDARKEPATGDLFAKGLFPGFKALGVSNTSGPLELLRIHVLPAPTAAKAKGVLVSVEKRRAQTCVRETVQKGFTVGL